MDGSSVSTSETARSGNGGVNLLNSLENDVAGVVGSAAGAENGEAIACVHYERKCYVVAPCCGVPFGCRVCHDEMSGTACGPMDRFAIKEVICKECNTRQSSA